MSDDLPWQLVAARGAHLAGTPSLAGALLFPGLLGPAPTPRLRRPSRVLAGSFPQRGRAGVVGWAGTAWLFVDRLEGGIPGLLGTAHGGLALGKLALFLALLGCAAANRLVFAPTLPASRPRLRASIAVEMALGLAVLALAASLSAGSPGAPEPPDPPFAL